MRSPVESSAGFTLIELLVVVAIIGLLAAILFPVFGRVRENGRRTACQSNLKQFALAVAMYVQDYDERYPMGLRPIDMFASPPQFQTGLDDLMTYTKSNQIAVCPSDSGDVDIDFTAFGSQKFSYAGNDKIFQAPILYELNGDPPQYPSQASEIKRPAQIPLIYEAANHDDVAPGSTADSTAFPPYLQVEKRHFNGADCLFVDGHVKWFKGQPGISDPTEPYPNDYWNVSPGL